MTDFDESISDADLLAFLLSKSDQDRADFIRVADRGLAARIVALVETSRRDSNGGDEIVTYDGSFLDGAHTFRVDSSHWVGLYDGDNFVLFLQPRADLSPGDWGTVLVDTGVPLGFTVLGRLSGEAGSADAGWDMTDSGSDSSTGDTTAADPAYATATTTGHAQAASATPAPAAQSDYAPNWASLGMRSGNALVNISMAERSPAERIVPFRKTEGGRYIVGEDLWHNPVDLQNLPAAATGTVRFVRNRLTPNEFFVENVAGEVDIPSLEMELRQLLASNGFYPWRDADRVRAR